MFRKQIGRGDGSVETKASAGSAPILDQIQGFGFATAICRIVLSLRERHLASTSAHRVRTNRAPQAP
jgi:hypothetical protein